MQYENYDPCFPDQPVVDLYLPIWSKFGSFRSKPAFIWSDEDVPSQHNKCTKTLTYHQLNNSVQTISSNLLLTLSPRDTVLVLCAPGLELVEVIFGCQRAGLVAVPLIPPEPSFSHNNHPHLVRAISQTKPKAAIADSDYIKRLSQYLSSANNNMQLTELLQEITWISTEDLKEKKLENLQEKILPRTYKGCRAEDLYLIQYTSGATGIPKPVLVTAGAAAHNVRVARKSYDLHPNSVIVSWLPQYHDCGLMFLLLTIVSGATCVLTSPQAFITRPRLWLELITQYKGTCTPVPSFTLPLVLKRGDINNESLIPLNMATMKNLIIINEPIYSDSVQEFTRVFNPFGLSPSSISPSYGLAENCTFVSTAWRSGNNPGHFLPVFKNLLPSARLLSLDGDDGEIEIFVVDKDSNEPVEDGLEGEIWISSPSNASGYLSHPSLTQEVFNGQMNSRVSKCYVRTGDSGVIIGKERYLFVTGRYSDIIQLPNKKLLHPHYIESAACKSCPKLIRAGCVAAFTVADSIVIVAELQKGEREANILKKTCERIRMHVMKEANVKVGLVALVKNGNVPKTTSGKIQRWLTKHRMERDEMDVIMQIKFEDEWNSFLSARSNIVKENGGRYGYESSEEGFSFASTTSTLRSSL
ncbi:hypothetical protein Leryth_012309 [Lithospermum erythrorhizon]|nr:hypothetical protein Leryth_012309 [Lithospermum erythrorhizon]